MPSFNKRTPNQDVLMAEVMTPQEQDPGSVKPEDFVVENEDPARLRRILKFTDVAGKSSFVGTPDRNKATATPRKSKS
jgi:hypothetical protein